MKESSPIRAFGLTTAVGWIVVGRVTVRISDLKFQI
jgi:hypothetical protein